MKAEWYQKNKGHADHKNKKWASDNRERSNAIKKRYTETFRAEHNQRCLRWHKENPGKSRAVAMKRHCAKKQRTPVWLSPDQLKEIDEIYERAAQIQQLTGIETHVDHIIPLQGKNVSGLHAPWNLRIISGRANRKKHNKYVTG